MVAYTVGHVVQGMIEGTVTGVARGILGVQPIGHVMVSPGF